MPNYVDFKQLRLGQVKSWNPDTKEGVIVCGTEEFTIDRHHCYAPRLCSNGKEICFCSYPEVTVFGEGQLILFKPRYTNCGKPSAQFWCLNWQLETTKNGPLYLVFAGKQGIWMGHSQDIRALGFGLVDELLCLEDWIMLDDLKLYITFDLGQTLTEQSFSQTFLQLINEATASA